MKWDIAYVDSIDSIRASVSGTLTALGVAAMEAELLTESKRRHVNRWLCDCRDVGQSINLSEVYELPAKLRELGVTGDHLVAFVYTPGSGMESLLNFFDDRSYNIGLTQRAFADYDGACLWLTSPDKRYPGRPALQQTLSGG